MKAMKPILLPCAAVAILISCGHGPETPADLPDVQETLSLRGVARMLASLPIGQGQLEEVYNAVNSSSGNGFDEEYMMSDLVDSPGSGVGESEETKALTRAAYDTPLRDLIAGYVEATASPSTKAGAADVQAYLDALASSGMQIYWPYSEDWDGEQLPLITFDPGYGAESNYAYEIAPVAGSYEVVDSVYVDENVAAERPVWVINRNDDSGFTPMSMFLSKAGASLTRASSDKKKNLYMKSFTMTRHYDSWFAGASEFFIKIGAVNGFYASSEAELQKYTPSVTDLMVVVKRKYLNKKILYDAVLVTDFSEQLEKLAFLITESDGGTRTSWKCEASVKIKSKTYGFDLDIPLYSNDDIVWRGQLDASYFTSSSLVTGRFGDVIITFKLE